MPTAEILTIGTELLLGEIVDTNARYLARRLRDLGIDLYRITTVGDNVGRIAQAIREGLQRADLVLTTGGLGPTVDDPTREAVAQATGCPLVFRQDLWDGLVARYARYGRTPSENNKRQAYVPEGARVLPNPVGTAPAFAVETSEGMVISLPGVPREMETIFEGEVVPLLRAYFGLTGVILARVLHTVGMPESVIDERLADLERRSNPTVGLAAHPAQVDVRITAKAPDRERALAMVSEIEAEIRRRLGDEVVYGVDEETLEGVVARELSRLGMRLFVAESGLFGALVGRLSAAAGERLSGEVLPLVEEAALVEALQRGKTQQAADVALGAVLRPEEGVRRLRLFWLSPQGETAEREAAFAGPPDLAQQWAVHLALGFAWRRLRAMP